MVIPAIRSSGPLGDLIGYIGKNIGQDGYISLRRKFIDNGCISKFDSSVRKDIIRKFEIIDSKIKSGTSRTDGLFLAEALLSLGIPGNIVECGCYYGASTAKLSIICKVTGRKLCVFDSFEGLPEGTDKNQVIDYHARFESGKISWKTGDYAARLDQVKANIEDFGEIAVCSLYKGWFEDTLNATNLPQEIPLAFVDVDMAASAQDCLVAIWPRLSNQGIYFSHDAAFIQVLQAMHLKELWNNTLKDFPPVMFGAGYGMGDSSPHLGYMVKGDNISPGYIKGLAILK